MDKGVLIYKNIVEHTSSGVMTLDPEGRIMTFNAAASSILGTAADQVLGRSFGQVFMTAEGMDDFNQTILDAVYDTTVGHQKAVEVNLDGKTRSIAVTTSYLQDTRDNEARKIGIIALFNDITEIKELREAELRLAKAAKAQHAELQKAYLDIEEKNQALTTALKKVQVMRVAATITVVGLFLGVGVYAWNTVSPSSTVWAAAPVSEAPVSSDPSTVVVAPQRIASTVSLVGNLAPRREVNVTSPITGKVAATHFQYGERVAEGQRLIDLDTTEVEREYREAQAAHIKALQHFKEIEDWTSGIEVSRARRAITKAKLALEDQKNKLDETALLLQRGVIPASEHEATEQQHRNLQLDYESLQQDLEAVLAKGDSNALEVAQLDLDNARLRIRELEDTLRAAVVDAPVAGVILQPPRDKDAKAGHGGERLVKGRSVTQGELLLTIGDLDGLSVVGEVDEVDIVTMRAGQTARVSGDAFPGLELLATIVHVSSQASQDESRAAQPSFEVVVAVDNLTEEQRQRVRLGMSANLEILVYDKPNALLVPIDAVEVRAGGEAWLSVVDKETRAVRQVRVETGVTTLEAVEIVHGLEAGDEVLLAGL